MGKKWWLDVFTLQLGPTSLIGFTIGKRKSGQIPKENCTWDHVSLWGAWLHFPNEKHPSLHNFVKCPYEVVKG